MSATIKDINKEFLELPSYYLQVGGESFFIRKHGQGPALVFIHGFFVSGYTWRFIVSYLSKYFTCYIIDTPGFGRSKWAEEADLSFAAQASRFEKLFKAMNLSDFNIVAQDTGASIMRLMAAKSQLKINKLIFINTEIPNHRPPFIQMHQFFAKLPLSNLIFRSLIKIKIIVRSKLLINQFYSNKSLLKRDDYIGKYLKDLASPQSMDGMLKYLIGIDWKVVDNLPAYHSCIKNSVLFIWGADDKTFPIELARPMKDQFRDCTFHEIKNSSLMPHEEQPEQVSQSIKNFILPIPS